MSIEGKTALVTGANRGIGAAIVGVLAELGAFVIGTSRSETGANSITESVGALGRGQGLVLDVSDDASVDGFFELLKSDYAMPAILVNNAGITSDNLALRMKPEEWTRVLETNLHAIFKVTSKCLRDMTRAKWGRIINISSVVGSMGNPGQSNYAAAKAGMEGYSRVLAAELASRNITVNCVAPGFIETDMTDQLSESQKKALLARVPAGRLGQASEVAHLVGFLAGENAAYVTGETIHINGGMYMS